MSTVTKQKKSASKSTETAARHYMDLGSLDLDPERVVPSPQNPRKYFDDHKLQSLAESLRTHGQQQNITVRALDPADIYSPDATFELISGERRYRAAKLAELRILHCRVVCCDDVTALELRGEENYRRADFNAVEEAIWFQQLIETGQYNQKSLADYLRIDPSQVSNRLRLLQLPDEWQQRIVLGELPPTHARELVSWKDRPQILAAIEANLKTQSADEVTVSDFQTWILTEVNKHSRSLEIGNFNGPKFGITDELLKELDAVEVSTYVHSTEKTLRAFNVELWDRLQKEAAAKANERVKDSMMPANDSPSAPTAEEPAKQDVTIEGPLVSGIDNPYLESHFALVFADEISPRLNIDVGLRLLFASMAGAQDADFLMTVLAEKIGRQLGEMPNDVEVYESLRPLTSKKLTSNLIPVLQTYLKQDQYFSLDLLLMVAKDLGINGTANWQPPRALLEFCTTEELKTLFTDEMGAKKLAKLSREKLLDELMTHWPPGYLPELLTPDLLKAPPEEGKEGDQ